MAVAVAVAVARAGASPVGLIAFAVGAIGLAIAAPFIAAAMAALALALYWVMVTVGVIAGVVAVKSLLDVATTIAEGIGDRRRDELALAAWSAHCADVAAARAQIPESIRVQAERVDKPNMNKVK